MGPRIDSILTSNALGKGVTPNPDGADSTTDLSNLPPWVRPSATPSSALPDWTVRDVNEMTKISTSRPPWTIPALISSLIFNATRNNSSILHEALNQRIEKSLLLALIKNHKEDLTKRDDKRNSPLALAIDMGIDDFEILSALMEEKSVLNSKNINNETPLDMACNAQNFNAIYILDPGKLTNQNQWGETPLSQAIISGVRDFNILKFLIDENEDVLKMKTIEDATPLNLAIYTKNFEAINYLLEMKASHTTEFDSECFLLKKLGHILTLEKDFMFNHKAISTSGTYNEKAFFSLIKELLESKECPSILKDSYDEGLNDALENAIDNYLDPALYQLDKILKRIQAGETTIVNMSVNGHAFYGVIHNGYFLVFNRGYGKQASSVMARKIKVENFSEKDLELLLKHSGLESIEQKYEKVNELGEQDDFCKALEKVANHKDQIVGNCGWVGPKLLAITMLTIPKVIKEQKGKSQAALEAELSKGLKEKGKAFGLLSRLRVIEEAEAFKDQATSPQYKDILKQGYIQLHKYAENHPDAVKVVLDASPEYAKILEKAKEYAQEVL